MATLRTDTTKIPGAATHVPAEARAAPRDEQRQWRDAYEHHRADESDGASDAAPVCATGLPAQRVVDATARRPAAGAIPGAAAGVEFEPLQCAAQALQAATHQAAGTPLHFECRVVGGVWAGTVLSWTSGGARDVAGVLVMRVPSRRWHSLEAQYAGLADALARALAGHLVLEIEAGQE